MDTIRTLAAERYFFSMELKLRGYGQLLLTGDEQAVDRVLAILAEHDEHDLIRLPDPLPHSE
jgi:hypothetical protein